MSPSDDDGPFTGKDFLVTSTVTAPLDQFWIDNVNGFTTTNKVAKGRSIKYKARVAGIYQLTSTWIERGSEIELVSAPITLTVEPKTR